MVTPTRKTSERELDQWNQQMRGSPLYQNFLKQQGLVDSGRGVTMNDRQRQQLEQLLSQGGMAVPGGMHIDAGGNLNQKNTLWKNVAKGAAIGGAALTGFGAAGIGPMAGLFGASAAAPAAGSLTAGLSGAAPAITPGAIAAGSTAGTMATGAGTAAAAAGGGGMFGLSLPMTNLIAQGAQGVAGSLASSAQGKRAERVAMLEAALRESALNPFRAANSQGGSLMAMDRAMNTSPTTIQPGGQQGNRYSSLQGGQYQMSPELLQWLTELRQRMASGSGANPNVSGQNVLPNMNLTRRG